jgi:hypothetical protein
VNQDPQLSPVARSELEALGFPVARLLFKWLRQLGGGAVPVSNVRPLLGAPHDPPWQWVRYVDDVVVIFRFLSDAELVEESLQGPQLLVARITSESRLAAAAQNLLKDAP